MRYETPLVLVLAACVAAACGAGEDAPEVLAPPVAIVTVQSVDLEDRIGASGELVARLQTSIAAEISGRVTELVRDEGDAVAAEEVILTIDPERRELEVAAAEARVARADASHAKAKRETDRVRRLHRDKVASKSKLDSAETDLKLAAANAAAERAQYGVARRAVDDATVTAPFAGILARRHVNRGQFVQPGTPLLELVSLDPIDIVFHLAEVDSGRVQVGQKVEVKVAPYPDRSFEAVVDVVSPTIDSDSRTLRVKAVVSNSQRLLRPGLFARADLGVALRSGVLLVPEEAVLQRSDGAIVFALVEGSRVERRKIRTGGFHEGEIEVTEGLVAGDVIVVRGHTDLIDGAAVRIPEPPSARDSSGLAAAEPPRSVL